MPPRPTFGRLADFTPRMAGYTIAYYAYHGLRKLTGHMAFQLFARRPEAIARRQRAAA